MRRCIALSLAATVVAADLLSKAWAFAGLAPGEHRWIVGEFLALAHVWNRGVTGGLGKGLPPIVITLATAAAAVGIGVYLLRSKSLDRLVATGLGLVLGGAIGNLYDRIVHGQVRDFIDVWPRLMKSGWLHHWPTFNVADAAIVAGVIGLVVHMLFFSKKPEG